MSTTTQPANRFVDPRTAPELRYEVPSDARSEVVIPAGQQVVLDQVFGLALADGPGPQGFLVHLPPGSVNGAHFHPVDQFQVFFGSDGGWYQRNDVRDDLVHYTDAFSTYGPFGSRGPDGLEFYTLRAKSTTEVAYMPRERSRLVRRGMRNMHVSLASVTRTSCAAGESAVEVVAGPDADGLAIYLVCLGRDAVLPLQAAASRSAGQYVCVLRGCVSVDGQSYGRQAIAWTGPGEQLSVAASSEHGAEILILQFPQPGRD
jgi:hypothetical protein